MKARFTSPDTTETMTIIGAQGKRGWNVKVSIKKGKGKGQPKAKTGCRETFKTEKEAKSAFDKLVKESKARGWKELEVSTRSAFSAIPEPSKSAKAAATPTVQ